MLRSGVNKFYRHSGALLCPITYLLTVIVLLDNDSFLSSSASGKEDDNASSLHTNHIQKGLALNIDRAVVPTATRQTYILPMLIEVF